MVRFVWEIIFAVLKKVVVEFLLRIVFFWLGRGTVAASGRAGFRSLRGSVGLGWMTFYFIALIFNLFL